MTGRTQAMVEMYRGGQTLQQIGDAYGLSRERVRQIICGHVQSGDGGAAKRAKGNSERRNAELSARRNARSMRQWGMCWADYRAFITQWGGPGTQGSPMR